MNNTDSYQENGTIENMVHTDEINETINEESQTESVIQTPEPIKIALESFSVNFPVSNTIGDITPRFEWSTLSGSPVANYQVYVGRDAANLSLFGQSTNNFYETPKNKELYAGEKEWDTTTYYWQVKALDSNGNLIGESNIANFNLVKSLVGKDTLAEGIYLNASSGVNPVFTIREFEQPGAYGGNLNGVMNVTNACIFGGYGFSDLGIVDGVQSTIQHTRQHEYQLDFDATKSVKEFSLQMADWGDYLPYGGNADGVYWVTLFAYNNNDQLLDQDRISFTSTGTQINRRITQEFGNLSISGDICTAKPGEPGNYTFNVSSSENISYVVLKFKDRESMDPNIGFRFPVINGVDTSPGVEPVQVNPTPTVTATPIQTTTPLPTPTGTTPTPTRTGSVLGAVSTYGPGGRVLGASTTLSATGFAWGPSIAVCLLALAIGFIALKKSISQLL